MIELKSKYYYTRLSKAEKKAYDSILSGWLARNRTPSLISNPLNEKIDIQKIINFISLDNPGLFYVDFSRLSYMTMALKVTIQSEFLYNDKQITEIEKLLQETSAIILGKLSPRMDDYEKELVLHDCLAVNISYDNDGATTSGSVVGGLLMRKAVCEGYAKSFKLLCDQIGLPSIVVTGTAKPHDKPQEELHAWNIVKLNNKEFYHVDVTWNSTMRTGKERKYDYFNLTDNDIAKSHLWDKTLFPACTSSISNWFIKNGNIVRDDAEFKNYIIRQVKTGSKNFSVKLGRKYKNHKEVMEVIQSALRRTNLFGGYSLSLEYNDTQNIATVRIS